jgi:hypothetical protein
MNKVSLAIVALGVLVAATAIGVFAMAQDAQARNHCSRGSICQSNSQSSRVNAGIISRASVGNQDADNSIDVS